MEANALVECYSGVRFAERPTAFRFMGRRYVVEEVLKTWIGPSATNFVVSTREGGRYQLIYDELADEWIVLCLAAEAPDAMDYRGKQ